MDVGEVGLDELRLKSPQKHVLLPFAVKNTENNFAESIVYTSQSDYKTRNS